MGNIFQPIQSIQRSQSAEGVGEHDHWPADGVHNARDIVGFDCDRMLFGIPARRASAAIHGINREVLGEFRQHGAP